MCVDHDARLPALPRGRHNFKSERITLVAEDGNKFGAFSAIPEDTARTASIIVLPDVRGLFGFYEDLACQFAAWGYPAVAIDYFGRTAGTGPRTSEFAFMDHIAETDSIGPNADIASAVEFLRSGAPEDEVYTVGFCFGGSVSWAAGTHGHGLAGVMGLYGKPDADRPAGDGPIWDRCHLIECKVLALMGGAPHSFFDRTQADHVDESLDAWNRMLAFIA